jgi:hypothetical protein
MTKTLKIHDVKVDWMEGYANDPHLTVTWHVVNEDGSEEPFDWRNDEHKEIICGLKYEKRENLVLAKVGDHVKFNSICDRKDGGYGGSSFTFELTDGTMLENVGAWSSRSSVMNRLFTIQCKEVGSNAGACAVDVAGLVRWMEAHPKCGFGLSKVYFLGDEREPYYLVTYPDGKWKNDPDKHKFLGRLV